jgi:hypothetical protein
MILVNSQINIKIFPNPANEKLSIEVEKGVHVRHWRIVNVLVKTVQ